MSDQNNRTSEISRRKLLARLGLAAGAVYVTPALLHLTPANASGVSRSSGPSGPSGPSRASRPSGPSRASRPSGPSRPSGGWSSGRSSGWNGDRDWRGPRQSNAGQEIPQWLRDILRGL